MTFPKNSELPIRLGVYGVLVYQHRVLMTHTHCGTRSVMNFPGGGVAPGEDLLVALSREFREEVGIEPRIGKLIHTSDDALYLSTPDFPKQRLIYHYFLVEGPIPTSLLGNGDDVERLFWCALDALPFDQMLSVDAAFCRNYLLNCNP